jgi:hypothetical protein
LPEYAASLDERMGWDTGLWSELAREVEASAYGGRDPTAAAKRDMLARAKQTRVRRRLPQAMDEIAELVSAQR